ncbi:DUF6155 family protein [Desulfosediminicola ganghwensis]|uniref:DUF6155 family protein n=1 Tax=Desulfosediminicola ganghwensis TaxID=2569540 RepID=UPI0010AB806D|nr:DUF6155 family protein [Desulfosediminicola ganghwensis]
MKVSDLKKKLDAKTKEDLIKDVLDLFKKNQFVKDYYIEKESDNQKSPVFLKHKEIIEKEFFPERGDGKARLSVAKKAISEFKNISTNNVLIADLMIFYVETGVNYTNEFGDINENFYLSMENMYEQALKFIVANKLSSNFQDRCLEIVEGTVNIGWGFHDQISFLYESCFG